jgi:cyanuric acid amidohydrolase
MAGNKRQCRVDRVPMRHPGDTSAIEKLLDDGLIEPSSIVAIFGKTEGNGCVNDFTRAYAVLSIQTMLARKLNKSAEDITDRVAIVISGGTEGGLSPHFIVFSVAPAKSEASEQSLAIGTAFTENFRPEEVGRLPQVHATAKAVLRAMEQSGIESPTDVHFVQIKCPLLTSQSVADAASRGHSVATEDTYASMGLSRGASALGVGLALGEIAPERLSDSVIGSDLSLWSARASVSAGVELARNEVTVLGNSSNWVGNTTIAHGVMRDSIDFRAVQDLLRAAGFSPNGQLCAADADRISAILVKAEPPRSGSIRGNRHVMWDDSDINPTRHARALVGGVVAAAIGRTDLFVSGGAEHQGPDGGGPIAVIARRPG